MRHGRAPGEIDEEGSGEARRGVSACPRVPALRTRPAVQVAMLLAALALALLAPLAAPGGAGASPPALRHINPALARCAGSASAGCASAPAATRPAPPSLLLGTQRLQRCEVSPLAYCGTLSVPLDTSAPWGPHIALAYRWYPAPSAKPAGTVVPVEGGPGYGSIGSVAGGFIPQYGALLQRFNMLAVDNRGTGHSTPVDCPALQGFSGPTGTVLYQRAAAACAAALNRKWHYPGGGAVHASDLFNSAPAAADLASVIAALELPAVDLYGDSYGSFFAQVFAARFPSLVHSVILDSTYQVQHLDPWYRSAIGSMPTAFDAACARAPACTSAAPGSSWARLEGLAALLREHPIAGTVPGPTGSLEHVRMDIVGLVDLINDAAADPQIYRALDAASRALVHGGEPAPLLRLYAERLAEDEAYFGLPASSYSDGLYLAASCLDYPQLFEMGASGPVRSAQLRAAEEALAPSTFSPFTTSEWLAQNQNTEAYTACLGWPSPTIAQPPTSGSPPLFAATLPVLVLGGELDTWTPPADIGKVLAEIGGHTRFIELANATHVVGQGSTVCGSALIQAFVSAPARLDSLDAGCASQVPAIHTIGAFPARLADVKPLQPEPAAAAVRSAVALKLASAALATAGDAVAREAAIATSLDRGLHGGDVTADAAGTVLHLHGDQLVPGVAVSGTVTLAPAPVALDGQSAHAQLSVSAQGQPAASFTADWSTQGTAARAQVSGTVGGETVSGSTFAP